MHKEDCLFCKIVRKEIPSKMVYEDDDVYAFEDIHPSAPVHFLIIPKRHITSLQEVTPLDAPLLGKMMTLVPQLALEQGCHEGPKGGFRIIVNNGDHGKQEIPHVHIHVLGGPRPWKLDGK